MKKALITGIAGFAGSMFDREKVKESGFSYFGIGR